jgi:ElaB/YqjD/DUF883 family membrane-anchored ribosome-binding protein
MKTFVISIMMIALSFTMIGCLNQESVDTIDFSELEQMNQELNEDIETIPEERTAILQFYVSQIKERQASIQTIKNDLEILVDELKEIRQSYEDEQITLDDDTKAIIIQAFKTVRLNRVMLTETIGQVYQPLRDLYQNRDAYTQDQAKQILINVYNTLNARQQLYENIFQALEVIQTNL